MLIPTGQMSDSSSQGQRVADGKRRGRRQDRGVAVVEFTFVAFLLFMLIFGIIGYGYMMSFRQAISQGAAEGARAAAVSPAGFTATQRQTAARNALNEALANYGISCSSGGLLSRNGAPVGTCGITIATCVGNTGAQCASVAVDYGYRSNPLLPSFPGLGAILPQHLQYTAVAEVS
jgi:Flp pilus assembly protein TadG